MTNKTSLSEEFYLAIGSTWTLDTLYLFFILPCLTLSVVLNLVAFYICFKFKIKKETTPLYSYFKVYFLNNMIMCFFGVFIYSSFMPRYFSFDLNYWGRIYRCFITNSVITLLTLFTNCLDLVIGLERLSIFEYKLNWFKALPPYKTSLITFLICVIINLPTFFWNYIKR